MEGAGAFVCGEETALLASIQGERGMPHFRPPYPAVKGLWDMAHADQQCRDLRLRSVDPAQRARRRSRRWVPRRARERKSSPCRARSGRRPH